MMEWDLRVTLIEQTGERIEHQHDDISDKQEQRRMDQLPHQHAQRVPTIAEVADHVIHIII